MIKLVVQTRQRLPRYHARAFPSIVFVATAAIFASAYVYGDEVAALRADVRRPPQAPRAAPSEPALDATTARLRLIATLHDPAAIRKILAHLGIAPSGLSPGPAPPAAGAGAP